MESFGAPRQICMAVEDGTSVLFKGNADAWEVVGTNEGQRNRESGEGDEDDERSKWTLLLTKRQEEVAVEIFRLDKLWFYRTAVQHPHVRTHPLRVLDVWYRCGRWRQAYYFNRQTRQVEAPYSDRTAD